MKLLIFRIFTSLMLLAALFVVHGFCAQVADPHNLRTHKSLQVVSFEREIEEFLCTELYFGINKPDGEISEQEFADFLDKVITPELPDGLTVLNGVGQFKNSQNRIVREKSKVIILLYPKKIRKEANRKIERIRKQYKRKFQQESVLRVDSVNPVRISF